MEKITEHFSYEEMVRTGTPYQLLNAEKGRAYIEVLGILCKNILEPIREHYGKPVIIHSGYRCAELNGYVGGADNSNHLYGQAADLHVDGVSNEVVFSWLWKESGLKFSELILEHNGGAEWIHVAMGGPRKVMKFENGKYTTLA